MYRRGFITALVIAFWVLTPEIACLFPGAIPAEADHCGRLPKPDVQKCCHALVQPKAVVTAKADEYPQLLPAALPTIALTIDSLRESAFAEHWLDQLIGGSPPRLSQKSLGVLRI